MAKVRGVAVALALLVAVWGILYAVAWLGDAVPRAPLASSHEARDAGVEDAALGEGDASSDAAVDAQPETASLSPTELAAPLPRAWQVCPVGTTHHRAWLDDVVGDETPELVVACGAVLDVFVFDADGDYFAPRRVLSVTTDIPAGSTRVAPLVSGMAVGDFVGGAARDLAVGFRDAGPMSTSGSVVVFGGNEAGGFERPSTLASIPVADVARVPSIGGASRDHLAVLNAGQEIARRPAELWFYETGTVLVRRQVLRTTVGASRIHALPNAAGLLAVHAPLARAFGVVAWNGAEWALEQAPSIASESGLGMLGADRDTTSVFSLGPTAAQIVRDGKVMPEERVAILDGARALVDGARVRGGVPAAFAIYEQELRPLRVEGGSVVLDETMAVSRLPTGFPRVGAVWLRDLRGEDASELVLFVHGTTARGPSLVVVDDYRFEGAFGWSEEVASAKDAPLLIQLMVR